MQEIDKVIESEREVLGNIISNNSLILKTIGKIKEDDFYSGTHRILYLTMLEMYKQDNKFDLIILLNKLKSQVKEKLISVTEVTNISSCGYKSTFESHLNAVIESSRQRKLSKLMQMIENSDKNSQDKINYIQDVLMKMTVNSDDDKVYNAAELLEMSVKKIEEAYNNKGGITGVPTGFEEIDKAINGLQRKNMIIFGARPSLGKTAFTLRLIENMEANVLFVQLDMGLDEIGCRMLASESDMSNGKVSRGKLYDNEWGSLMQAFSKLSCKNNLMFYSPAEATVSKIRAKAKEIKTKRLTST